MQHSFSVNGGKLPVKVINGKRKVVLYRTLPVLNALAQFLKKSI